MPDQICSECDATNRPEARFCDSCGNRLVLKCPACSQELRAGAKFCDGCGAPVATAALASSEPNAAPENYTPRHLADKILSTRSALEGERKQVTVLFADIKGSMELASAIDPEAWHRILDGFFSVLTEGVHRFEGTVNQYTGDGIMALFGAPIAHEDHAQRACYAALHLRDKLSEQAREVKREYGFGFSTRIGLNSGEVVVGKIGDDLRMDYTAQGLTVGLAARMEELAEPNSIYLSEATAGLVDGYFELEDLGGFRIAGLEDKTHAFDLRGLGALQTRFDVSRARGLTRFVGRGSDMQVLDDALDAAIAGRGQVVGVVADAGTGKSRLCFEFLERVRARGLRVDEGHAVPHGKNIPFLPMLQVFRGYYGIDDLDDPRTVRDKIAGRLLLLDESFRDALPMVFDLFGAPDPELPVLDMDPDSRRRQLFGVLRRVVQGEGEPGVALIEDLHWLDATSESFLAQWVEAAHTSRTLLLVNFRPEYHADWMHKSYYRQLPLAPLGPEAIESLLDDLLGQDASVKGLAARIHERTAGNPFFTEEVVQSLIESGQLEGSRGAYRLVGSTSSLAIPSTVQSLLAARIDRLPEREKHVLQAASVLGKEFSEPILREVADTAAEELPEALAKLKDAEFIYEHSLYPVAEYAFKHPLTQEVALGTQLQERRRALHARAARAFEESLAEKLDENAALLAHHFEEAEEDRSALLYHDRAAHWVNQGDPVAAIRHWLRVSELAKRLPADPEIERVQLAATTSALTLGAWRMGLSKEEVDDLFAAGRRLAVKLDDRGKLANLIIGQGSRAAVAGKDVRAYYQKAHEALALDDPGFCVEDRLNIFIAVGYSSFIHGLVDESGAAIARVQEITGGDPRMGFERVGYSAYPWALQMGGQAKQLCGEHDLGWEMLAQSVQVSREHDLQESLGWALGVTSHMHRMSGYSPTSLPDIVSATSEAKEIAERIASPFSMVVAEQNLCLAHAEAGHYEDAIRLAQSAAALTDRFHTAYEWEHEIYIASAAARLKLGDVDQSLRDSRRAIAICEALPNHVGEIDSRYCAAQALIAMGDEASLQEVGKILERSFELVEVSGAHTFAPLLLEIRAMLSDSLGDSTARDQDLADALSLFERYGARGHAARLRDQSVATS